jgi:hypothetical protein
MFYQSSNQRITLQSKARKTSWQGVVSIFIFALLLFPAIARADKVTDWNEIGTIAIVTNAGTSPPATTVNLAYVHAAIYDAVNAIDRRYSVFAVSVNNAPVGASQEAAAVAAAYNVLVGLFPTQQAYFDVAYATSLATIPDGQSKTDGIAVGAEVAGRFLAMRACDGRNANITYAPGSGPGVWQPTPPAFAPALTPWIAHMRPFAILSPWQFRAPGPLALDSKQWAKEYNEIKSLGSINSSTRTAEQTEIGRFYGEHVGAQFARIFRDFALARGMSLADNARLFAQLYISSADALIAVWDSKFYFGFWRPVTAIPAGDTDGNPETEPDTTWLPLLATPNHPEYPAAHGAFTGAYAEALRNFFGTKQVTITLTSNLTGTSRTFNNTNDLIKEIIEARIYAGLHYRTSGEDGVAIGKKVAQWVAKYYFQPVQ